jgi:hypothetical protein
MARKRPAPAGSWSGGGSGATAMDVVIIGGWLARAEEKKPPGGGRPLPGTGGVGPGNDGAPSVVGRATTRGPIDIRRHWQSSRSGFGRLAPGVIDHSPTTKKPLAWKLLHAKCPANEGFSGILAAGGSGGYFDVRET